MRDGLVALCASAWNGELHGSQIRRWIPDDLAAVVTNTEVVHLIGALTSPDVKRGVLFDAFLAENQLAGMVCPLRDRVESWPRETPIIRMRR